MTHVDFDGWQFISNKDAAGNHVNIDREYARADKSKPIVVFGSFQDLLGTNESGGIKAKNGFIHTDNWDLVIFDEYHFGAWRENAKKLFENPDDEEAADFDAEKYQLEEAGNAYNETFLPITTSHYLFLSGTPFRAISSGEFIEDQIYNWTYSDEQRAKENWVGSNNPYEALPRMVMLTYRIPDSIRQIAMQGEFNEFDLNVFFSAKGKGDEAKFVYENEVQKWLDLVRGSYLPSNIDDMKLSQDERPPMPYQMLIFSQCPHATLVAGYQKWQNQFSRHVLRGEKGISILAPTPYKIKVEKEKLDPDTKLPLLDADGNTITEEKEVQIPMFRPVKVFDVSQTDGKPLPERVQSPVAELTGNVEHYEAFMEALRRVSPVPIEMKPLSNDLDGFFSPSKQSITLRAGMSEAQTVCAAVHEIAHSELHDYAKQPNSQPKDSNTEEIEAESIAYTACAYFGIETSANSFGYVATWSKDKDLKAFKESLDTIRKTSSELISGVEQQFKEICKERGISPEPAQPAQKQPEQDTEKLYMVDNDKYVHVQRCDAGIDYTIYDAATAKALVGGVLDDAGQSLSAAALTVCKLHNIGDAAPIRLAPLELLNGLQEANELLLGAGEQITGVEATSAADSLLDLPQLEQDYTMPDPTVDFAQMYQFGYTDGNTMLPLSKERARELFLQDVPIFALNSDNTEYMVLDINDLDTHPGIFGVERTEWESVRDTLQPRRDIVAPKQPDALSYLHDDTAKTQPENYLKNAEMALEDDCGMIDGIINNGPKQTVAEQEERSSILAKLKAPVETTNRTEKHAPKRSAEKEL